MRITIWDMDYLHKFSFKPNITAMKLSSFHKQQEHIVNFVEQERDVSYDFDLMYIIREYNLTPFPPSALIDHKNVRLLGEEFKFFPNYFTTNMVIDMVRPDYRLYDLDKNNIYSSANMLQMLHNTAKLPVRQSENNIHTVGKKITIVTDKLLWKAADQIIIEVLDELLHYKNIFFDSPVELKKVLGNPEIKNRFINLHFANGVNQPLRNNYGHELHHAIEIIDLIKEIKTHFPHIRTSPVSFKTVLLNHWDELDLGIVDLERCLKIMDYAKQNKITIRFRSSSNRLITPFWPFFEVLDIWTEYHKYKSFVQMMLEPARRRQKLKWDQVLNNPQKWYSPRAEFLLHLIIKYPAMIKNYGMRLWGEYKLPTDKINIHQLSQYAFIFEQQDIQEKLQKELIGDEAIISGYRNDGI